MRIPDTTKTWIHYYEANRNNLLSVPWHLAEELTDDERQTISRSIRIFQLGESSEGTSLITATRTCSLQRQDGDLEPAMICFIREEQRHAQWLGQFMDGANIPRATRHWTDRVFRHLRHLWNLEVSLTVLLTAELIARVYYHALYRATASATLRAICRQLLKDEVFHVYFHTHLLRKIREKRSPLFHSVWNHSYRLFHAGTLLIVWIGHAAVLKKGGFSFKQYWNLSRHYCEQALDLLKTESLQSSYIRLAFHTTRRKSWEIKPS